jgi:hypothetical protein
MKAVLQNNARNQDTLMDASEECNKFGCFDVHNPCSTASLELEANEA